MPQAIEGTTHFTVYDVSARLTEAREYLAPVAVALRRQGVRVTIDAPARGACRGDRGGGAGEWS